MNKKSRAVVTVVGKDSVGILASVSTACAKANANVIEVTQSVLEEFFCMIMIVDISEANMQIDEMQSTIEEAALGMRIHVMHENIFDSMHRI